MCWDWWCCCNDSGMCVYVHACAATPLALVQAMTQHGITAKLENVEVIHMHTQGDAEYAQPHCKGRYLLMLLLEIEPGQFLVLFRPEQRRFGPVSEHFLFRSRNILSIFFVLSETVATVSLSAPPTVVHIRHWAVNTVPGIGQTMQFGDNYLNDGHLPPEIPK